MTEEEESINKANVTNDGDSMDTDAAPESTDVSAPTAADDTSQASSTVTNEPNSTTGGTITTAAAASTNNTTTTTTSSRSSSSSSHKKRSRSVSPLPPGSSNNPNSEATKALTSALQALATTSLSSHLPGLQAVLSTLSLQLSSKSTSSSKDAVLQNLTTNLLPQTSTAASKVISEVPPFVHLSARDSAPQLSIDGAGTARRLTVHGGLRGYRMVRASAGVDSGCWYYEVEVLNPPSVQDVVKNLPRNVRFGKKLKVGLRQGVIREEIEKEKAGALAAGQQEKKEEEKEEEQGKNKAKRRRVENEPARDDHSVGGHVRMGWSMRTGELQAPVGYDRWSYGYRDILGSRVHNSKREDRWGGVGFGPGDVIGFAICLVGPEKGNGSNTVPDGEDSATKKVGAAAAKAATSTNHIRFFKNGEAIGNFIVSRGVRTGGAAFDNIQSGTYYPAISSYMGGAARANFGPHFIYPPRGLPSGMKVRPMCEMCTAPISPEEALTLFKKEKVFGKKMDETLVNTFYGAVRLEATIRVEAYETHQELHVEEVRQGRSDRGLSTGDLPPPPEDYD